MIKKFKQLKLAVPFSPRDFVITLIILALAFVLSTAIHPVSGSDAYATLIFVLAVFMISLFTNGYLFGLLSSVISVLIVNTIFTYPYYEMNFSLAGYPITFICMLVVSFITCTLASRQKENEKLQMAAERERMRADLLRSISHDFRTPLTSIIGALDVMQNDNGALDKNEQKRLLADAKQETEWLSNMVENILSITRMSGNGTAHINAEPQIIEELIDDAIRHLKKTYPEIEVSIIVPDEIIFVNVDAMLIEQVIGNIFINSAIHGETTTKIEITVSKDKNIVKIEFQDNGKGISSKILPKLFQNNLFENNISKKNGRNAGIGLSVCETIIKAHGGNITAANSLQGACITFTLPVFDNSVAINE